MTNREIKQWRDNRPNGDSLNAEPTGENPIVYVSSDTILSEPSEENDYVGFHFSVVHVKTLKGNGFFAEVNKGMIYFKGQVHFVYEKDAYLKTLNDGEELVQQINDRIQKEEKLWEENKDRLKKETKVGDLILFRDDITEQYKKHWSNERYWIVLEVTQEMIDTTGINTDKPGLYAFGGMWYGEDPMDVKSYGKIDYLDSYYEIFFDSVNLTAEEIKKLVN